MLQVNKNYNADDKRDMYNANDFCVGDIIEASFQYSARIPYFYEIVRRTAATIYCKRLRNKSISDDGYGQNGSCVPIRNEYESDKIYSGRINKKTGRLRINDCLAYLWNGEPSDYYTD